jgi:uncharacterized membrane protein YqjE
MTYTFSISVTEYNEFAAHAFTRNKMMGFAMRYLPYFLIVLLLLIVVVIWKDGGMVSSRIVWAMSFLFFGTIWWFLIKKMLGDAAKRINPRDREAILGERTMTFTEDGYEFQTANANSRGRWSSVHQVEQTAHLYLIFTTTRTAILVPKHVFKTSSEKGDFEHILNKNGLI